MAGALGWLLAASAVLPSPSSSTPLTRPPPPPRKTTTTMCAAKRPRKPFFATQWHAYLRALDQHPMQTKMATAALLAASGDLFAQAISTHVPWSATRVLTLVMVNVVYITPLLTLFYAFNEWVSAKLLRLPSSTFAGTGVRLLIDQLINAPICIYGFFWAFRCTGEVVSFFSGGLVLPVAELVAATSQQIRAEYGAMLISNWKVWVIPQIANFRIVPLPLRVPFASAVALIWNVIQSIIANR